MAGEGMPDEGQMLDNAPDNIKVRLDYAWKWFSFHADQRVKMFNFMLITLGIFANAVVSSVDKNLPRGFGIALCVLGAVLALIFSRLDRRNRDLTWLGEDVLDGLERKNLFGPEEFFTSRHDQRVPYGILSRQDREEKIHPRSWWRRKLHDACLGKHRFWLHWVAWVIAAAFLVMAFFLYDQSPPLNHVCANRLPG